MSFVAKPAMIASRYRGRFAPSPTGPLHFGSLIAAVGSFLDARRAGGEWLVRIEDLDTPRNVARASESILETLERLGLVWDGPVVYQSARLDAYALALEHLRSRDLTFPCACSRKDLEAGVYPGTCRRGLAEGQTARSVRLRIRPGAIGTHDGVQGPYYQNLETATGDFVVRRADHIYAYHLAVVVDDAAQGITHVVRGYDLLDSTPRQVFLQQCLGLPHPRYAHLPVATNASGDKLSKQTHARPIGDADPIGTLAEVLRFLGHPPPHGLENASIATFWDWAIDHWRLARVPRIAKTLAPARAL